MQQMVLALEKLADEAVNGRLSNIEEKNKIGAKTQFLTFYTVTRCVLVGIKR